MTSTNRADQPVQTSSTPEALRVDVSPDGLTMYVGYAAPGSAEGAPEWRIKKLTSTTEGDVVALWAEGNSRYIHVWTDRAALAYA